MAPSSYIAARKASHCPMLNVIVKVPGAAVPRSAESGGGRGDSRELRSPSRLSYSWPVLTALNLTSAQSDPRFEASTDSTAPLRRLRL